MATKRLLTELKAANGGASDYRVAKLLGVSKQNVSAWQNGRAYMSDSVGIRAAMLLGLDPDMVLIELHIEREKGHDTSPIWKSIKERLGKAAMPVVVGFAGYGLAVLEGSNLI